MLSHKHERDEPLFTEGHEATVSVLWSFSFGVSAIMPCVACLGVGEEGGCDSALTSSVGSVLGRAAIRHFSAVFLHSRLEMSS